MSAKPPRVRSKMTGWVYELRGDLWIRLDTGTPLIRVGFLRPTLERLLATGKFEEV